MSALVVAHSLPQGGLSGALPFLPEMLAFLVGAGILGAAIAIPLFGVPVMLVLRAVDAESLPAYAAAGATGGFLLLTCLGRLEVPLFSWAGALYGAATGAWFWFLLRRPGASGAEDRAG
jgi:hypothetical protein